MFDNFMARGGIALSFNVKGYVVASAPRE